MPFDVSDGGGLKSVDVRTPIPVLHSEHALIALRESGVSQNTDKGVRTKACERILSFTVKVDPKITQL